MPPIVTPATFDAAAPEPRPVSVTRWTAQLVDRSCEQAYRWQRFAEDHRRATQLVVIVAVVSLLNVTGDLYTALQGAPLAAALARPALISVVASCAFLLVMRARTPNALEVTIIVCALAGVTMRMTMLTVHPELRALWPAWMVATLFVFYVYLPVRAMVSLSMAAVFSVGALTWWWLLQGPVVSPDLAVRGILWLLVVNGLGFMAANSLHRSQRTQYAQSLVLKQLLSTDALTGIANRRRFDDALSREWRRCARAGLPLSLLMIDVDHFKAYNDHCGHQQGDDCLRQVAQLLHDAVVRPGDLVARYGGEEFVCLLPEVDEAGARTVADRLVRSLRQANIAHPRSPSSPRLTISIGAAAAPDQSGEPDALVALADRLLYAAKNAGRDRVISGSLTRGLRDGTAPCIAPDEIALAS